MPTLGLFVPDLCGEIGIDGLEYLRGKSFVSFFDLPLDKSNGRVYTILRLIE